MGRKENTEALPDHPIRTPLPGQDLKKQESVLDDKTSALHVHPPPHERRIYSQYLRSPRSPLLAAYLSAGNLLSQILSTDDRMDPPKGGRLIWPALNIWASIMNLKKLT